MRNFRCELGEVDIVARDGKTLVFVEVKTRAYDDPAPEDQVNTPKRHQLTKAALRSGHKNLSEQIIAHQYAGLVAPQ